MISKILVIPDTQIRPEDDVQFLGWIGRYIVDKKPDVIVHLGDFADMASLSSYDKGKKSFEGRRYKKDIEAAQHGMLALTEPLEVYNLAQKKAKKKPYNPRKVMLLGNHEQRINRAIDDEPMLEGTISINDLPYDDWEVIPFLEPIVIEGVAFCHYFTSGVMGRPVGTAQLMLNKKHMSCFAGHQQGRNIAYGLRADGTEMTAIISGSCYTHDEPYLNPQTNNHWRGVWILHDVRDGAFDEMPLSLSYLEKKYGNDNDQH
jgi:hypothetical protein